MSTNNSTTKLTWIAELKLDADRYVSISDGTMTHCAVIPADMTVDEAEADYRAGYADAETGLMIPGGNQDVDLTVELIERATITADEMEAIATAIRHGLAATRGERFLNRDGEEDGQIEWEHEAFADARQLTKVAGMEWGWDGWREALRCIENHGALGGIAVASQKVR